ncbi:melatonin-related receptor-like [Branchiostoma floridae]|uniref:Melatonin-related receptor-like n=1 Tax=Branchiostoma floridae TaxID=7739 RepID=A0A9J7KS01_BRAFL|nr:melatonin-related receptor-like [Branchiostoma floridae]
MANQTVTSVSPALSDSENKSTPGYGVIFSSTVTGIFSAVGTIGNGMVITAFCTYRQVRTSANSFILSISISDIIITGFQYPVGMASSIIGAPSLGHAMCPILGALFFFSIYVSSSSMVLIAFNRCIHITMSTDTYRKLFSPFMSFLWILLSWVVSGLLVAPAFLGYGEFGWNKNRICSVMEGSPYSPQYVSNIFGGFYWLVFCVVVCLYVRIYLFSKKSVVTMAAVTPNLANPGQYVSKRMLKQTKHMFIIFSIFTVCTAPGVLFFSINVHADFLPFAAIVVSFMLYRLNYVLNPFLYAWKLSSFRRAFKALVRCKRQLPFQAGAHVN